MTEASIQPWKKRFEDLGISLDVWNTWSPEDSGSDVYYVEFYIEYEDLEEIGYDAPFFTIDRSFKNMKGVIEYLFTNYEDLLKQLLEALNE